MGKGEPRGRKNERVRESDFIVEITDRRLIISTAR